MRLLWYSLTHSPRGPYVVLAVPPLLLASFPIAFPTRMGTAAILSNTAFAAVGLVLAFAILLWIERQSLAYFDDVLCPHGTPPRCFECGSRFPGSSQTCSCAPGRPFEIRPVRTTLFCTFLAWLLFAGSGWTSSVRFRLAFEPLAVMLDVLVASAVPALLVGLLLGYRYLRAQALFRTALLSFSVAAAFAVGFAGALSGLLLGHAPAVLGSIVWSAAAYSAGVLCAGVLAPLAILSWTRHFKDPGLSEK